MESAPGRVAAGGGHSRAGVLVFLATKSLRASPFSAALLVGAVTVAVAFQVPNAANLAGYDAELLDHGVQSGSGDVRLRPRGRTRFVDADALAAGIREMRGVRAAVPVLVLPGAVGKNGRWFPAPVVGVDRNARRLPYRLRSSESSSPRAPAEGMFIGISLASKVGVGVGDDAELRIMLDAGATPTATPKQPLGHYVKRVRGTMRGVFSTEHMVAVDRAFLAQEAGEPGASSMILVYTDEPYAARAMARVIEGAFPEVQAVPWVDDVAMLATELRVNKTLGAVSAAMGAATVAFPIWALLHLSVLHQRRQIALLAASGFAPSDIFVVYLLKALVVGLVGTVLGIALGYGVISWFRVHPIFNDEHFVVRPLITMNAFVQPAVVVLATAVIAAVYPAWRAARVDPARALRSVA